jgi:DNA repair exonuclease SbcCD nuclease subunit
MKFLITADFHVENNKNIENIVETSDWIISVCKKENIDEVLILGDFLNSRDKIDGLAINIAVDILDKFLESSINATLLLGNHEKYSKTLDFKINSIRVFKKHAHVIDKFKVIKHEGYNFVFIPFIIEIPIFEDIVNKVKAKLDPSKTILFLHQPIQGAVVNDVNDFVDNCSTSPALFSDFKLVFSGHYHKYQNIGNATYVGSPVQLSHGEESTPKGVTILDLADLSSRFVLNPNYMKYITVCDLDADVKGKFVRFLSKEYKDVIEIHKIKEQLIERGARDVKFEILYNNHGEIQNKLEGINLTELVKKYIEVNKRDLNSDKLFDVGNKIRKQAKEGLL